MSSSPPAITNVIQINLGRCKAALDELYAYMINKNIPIALIQEPYVGSNNIIPHPASLNVFADSSDRPRSAIVFSPQLQIICHSQHLSRDLATCTIKTTVGLLHLASVYIQPPNTDQDDSLITETALGSIESVLSNLKGMVLVGGDFNAHHNLWGSERSNSRGEDICDFIASTNLNLLNTADEPTFFTVRDGVIFKSFIDLSLVSNQLLSRVTNWNVSDGVIGSDHRMILTHLDLSVPTQVVSTRQFMTQNVDWSNFNAQVQDCRLGWAALLRSVASMNDVEQATNSILSDVLHICKNTLPYVKSRKHIVPWWDPKLSELRRTAMRLKKQSIRVTTPTLRSLHLAEWKKHLKQYKEALKKAKRDNFRGFVSSQTRETVYSKVYRFCRNPKIRPPSTVKLQDGTFTNDAQSTAQYLLNQFLPDDDPLEDDPLQRDLRLLAQCDCLDELQADDLDFSLEEVSEAVSQQNDKKSPGKDGLSANIVKALHREAPEILCSLYNSCLRHSCFPEWFKSSVVKAIPKQSASDLQSAKAWRPISLISVPGKILESLLIARVNFFLRSQGLLSELQFGFTPHRSTVDAIAHVTDRMQTILDGRLYGAVVSLDVAGAFDNAWWTAILYKLKQSHLPHNLWHLTAAYFSGRSAELTIGGCTATKQVTRGCPQGSACGPGYWNILYDGVLKLKLPPDSELVAFADDIVLISWARTVEMLERNVNVSIDRVVEWGRSVKLTFGEAKTQAMVVTRRRAVPAVNFIMNGVRLTVVDELLYLGVILHRKLKWNSHLRKVQQKASKLMGKIAAVACNTWGLSSEVTETLYKGAIEPIVLYAVEVWQPALRYTWTMKLLNRIQRDCLLRVCKSYRTVSADALPIIANVMPLSIKASTLVQIRETKQTGRLVLEDMTTQIQTQVPSSRHPAQRILGFAHLKKSSEPPPQCGLTVYTDGSKSDNGVGAAYVMYQNNLEIYSEQFHLPNNCSVFQAELLAILKALEHTIETIPAVPIRMYTDSYSSLQAINDRRSTTPLVIKIQAMLLRHRQKKAKVSIHWVKAHIGIIGNERADQLAKDCLSANAQHIETDAPLSSAKRKLATIAVNEWNRLWSSSQNGRWTARIFPSTECRRKTGKIPLNFVLTQFLSGHGKFNGYLANRHCRNDPNCQCGEYQDAEHLLFHCPLTRDIRLEIEGDCFSRGFTFSVNSIHTILADPHLQEHFCNSLNQIHRRLVLWET